VNDKNGWVVSSREEPVASAPPIANMADLYTGRETWQAIDVLKLGKAMREAFENKESREKKSQQGKDDIYNYSYEKIAHIMKSKLGTIMKGGRQYG